MPGAGQRIGHDVRWALPVPRLTGGPPVPLDRQAIEKRDFPVGRRGYAAAAVDAHLAWVADQLEARDAAAPDGGGDALARSAGEQVRQIVGAAQASAAQIEREAREAAARIVEEARRDAQRTRAEALDRGSGHLGRVSGATQEMLERVEAVQRELGGLAQALRAGAQRVKADLSQLAPDGARPSEATPRGAAATGGDPAPAAPGADVDGARLIALNMALSGQAREETDRYLAENFDLHDREQLLDEVYASVQTG
jgi:hypothetical protein